MARWNRSSEPTAEDVENTKRIGETARRLLQYSKSYKASSIRRAAKFEWIRDYHSLKKEQLACEAELSSILTRVASNSSGHAPIAMHVANEITPQIQLIGFDQSRCKSSITVRGFCSFLNSARLHDANHLFELINWMRIMLKELGSDTNGLVEWGSTFVEFSQQIHSESDQLDHEAKYLNNQVSDSVFGKYIQCSQIHNGLLTMGPVEKLKLDHVRAIALQVHSQSHREEILKLAKDAENEIEQLLDNCNMETQQKSMKSVQSIKQETHEPHTQHNDKPFDITEETEDEDITTQSNTTDRKEECGLQMSNEAKLNNACSICQNLTCCITRNHQSHITKLFQEGKVKKYTIGRTVSRVLVLFPDLKKSWVTKHVLHCDKLSQVRQSCNGKVGNTKESIRKLVENVLRRTLSIAKESNSELEYAAILKSHENHCALVKMKLNELRIIREEKQKAKRKTEQTRKRAEAIARKNKLAKEKLERDEAQERMQRYHDLMELKRKLLMMREQQYTMQQNEEKNERMTYNKERVGYREQVLMERIENGATRRKEHALKEKMQREERIQKVLLQVPYKDKLLGITRSSKRATSQTFSSAATIDEAPILFPSHGFTDDQICGDVRFKLLARLQERGIKSNTYTSQVIRNFQTSQAALDKRNLHGFEF